MTRTAEALVTPAVLVWARESAHIPDHIAAKKVGVDFTLFKMWEDGAEWPSVAQLKRLAALYHRPVATFYLAEPPIEPPAPTDYRRASKKEHSDSSELIFAIRAARSRRDVALDLTEAVGDARPALSLRASRDEQPAVVAQRLRAALRISVEEQFSWTNGHAAFRAWRSSVESLGVLVFQFREVEVTEARGFALDLRPLPVAAVNIRDAINARCFSLLHETAHLLLGDGGLCDLHQEKGQVSDSETYCNRVAAETLIPREGLLRLPGWGTRPRATDWSLSSVGEIARSFSVSDEAMLIRLLDLGEIDRGRAWSLWRGLQGRRADSGKGGHPPPATLALAVAGRSFSQLVVDALHREAITLADASDYLDVRVKHLPAIERALLGQDGVRGGDA